MPIRALASALAVVLMAACSDDLTSPDVRVELVTPAGASPVDGIDLVQVEVREGSSLESREGMGMVADNAFEVPVTVGGGILDVRVRLSGPDGDLIGAPPRFFVLEAATPGGGFLVRVPVGRPRTCERVRFGDDVEAALPVAASRVGASRHGTFVVVAGGLAETGPTNQIGFLDLLQLLRGDYQADLNMAPGAVRAVGLSAETNTDETPTPFALGVADASYLLNIEAADGDLSPAGLPEGVGADSALVEVPTGGAFVAGGSSAASAAFAFVNADGEVTASRLSTPRRAPAAALLSADVLVAGGAAPGEPFAELIPTTGDASPFPLNYEDGVRVGGWLAANAGGTQALLGGGVGDSGELRTDTVWIRGCPRNCEFEPGPRWGARAGAVTTPAPAGGAWIVGGEESRSVERVRFGEEQPTIEAFAELAEPRAGAALLVLESGLLYVVGGRSVAGPSATVELCFPDALL